MSSVDLVVAEAAADTVNGIPVRRATLQFENPVGISTAKLFIVQNVVHGNSTRTEYRTVACAADLENLAEDEPPAEQPLQPYRTDAVDLVTDQPVQLSKFVDAIQLRVKSLLLELDELANLGTGTRITISSD